jgi:beta-galactosidase
VDNGNPVSHEDYKAAQRQAFHGLCLAILQSTRQAGPIRVTARAEGLKESSIELEAQAPAAPELALP